MDRIALISDIHSNIVALKAVLEDIENRGIHRIFCLGDLVLKGSSPCEVVDTIKEKCEIVLKGNCDEGAVNPQGIKGKEWYTNCLGKERLEYLDNLPMYQDIYMSGSYIRMFHATKNDFNDRILDTSSIEEKMRLFEEEEGKIPDMVIYADIHKQYMQKIKNKTIINIGSVGNPLEMSILDETDVNMEEMTQAHYCILEGEINSKERKPLSIQFVRVPYLIEQEIALAKENHSPNIESYILELKTTKYRGKKQKYIGKVAKNSLLNPKCLDGIKIEKEEMSEKRKDSIYTIKVYEDTVKYLAENLKSNQDYMYFWNEKNILILYKNKTFTINYEDKNKIQEAIQYGIHMGIPEEELDFKIGEE